MVVLEILQYASVLMENTCNLRYSAAECCDGDDHGICILL